MKKNNFIGNINNSSLINLEETTVSDQQSMNEDHEVNEWPAAEG